MFMCTLTCIQGPTLTFILFDAHHTLLAMPVDARNRERICRFVAPKEGESLSISEHVNALGMICSLVGLLIRVRNIDCSVCTT